MIFYAIEYELQCCNLVTDVRPRGVQRQAYLRHCSEGRVLVRNLVTVTSDGVFASDVEFVRSSGRQDPILWDVCILLKVFERNANVLTKSRCRRQFSRYTCPRCNLLYCSLSCFRAEVSQNLSFQTGCTYVGCSLLGALAML